MKEKIKKEQAAEKDYYCSVLLSQIFCCAVVVVMFFVFKAGGSGEALVEAYAGLLSDDLITDEVDTVMAEINDYLLNDDIGYAVSGSGVEPYTEAESTTVASEVETEAVFADVSEIKLSYEKIEPENTKLVKAKKTSFVFPVEGGRYTSYYGERTDPISEGDDYHNGVDIGADEGDEILAFSGGKVTEAGEDSRSGKYLFISHGNGYETFYCHCSSIIAEEGDIAEKGDVVALVGSTGYSTGPHLHFEIRRNGESLDPLPFLENAS